MHKSLLRFALNYTFHAKYMGQVDCTQCMKKTHIFTSLDGITVMSSSSKLQSEVTLLQRSAFISSQNHAKINWCTPTDVLLKAQISRSVGSSLKWFYSIHLLPLLSYAWSIPPKTWLLPPYPLLRRCWEKLEKSRKTWRYGDDWMHW